MANTIEDSGTITPVIKNDWTSIDARGASAKTFLLMIDAKALTAAEWVEFKIEAKTLTGSTAAIIYTAAYRGVQAEIVKQSIPVVAPGFETEYFIKQRIGTFTISGITGTVPDGSTVTGATSGATARVIVLGQGNLAGTAGILEVLTGTITPTGEQMEIDGSNHFDVDNGGTTGRAFEWSVNAVG